MTESDQTTRWRQAMSIGSRPAQGRGDCPDADTLALLIADPPAAPEGLLAHVERCSACSEELRSISELPELDTMVRQMAPRRDRTRGWLPLAAAACLVLAIGLAGYLALDSQYEPTLRTAPGASDVAPADGAVLARPPTAMTWSARADQSYRLVIYDEEAHRLWQSDPVASGRAVIPEAVRDSLTPGRYYWQLQVVGAGTVLGPFAFEVRTTDEP